MKLVRNIFMAGALLFSSTACDFGDTNVDPTAFAPDDVPLNTLMPTALIQTGYNIGGLGGRMPGIVMQHYFGADAQQVPYSTYVIGESDLNGLWLTGLYAGSMRLSIDVLDRAEPGGFPHYQGIAKIILAQNLGVATSFWGDVPYSEALKGAENLTPAFDTQEQVYQSIQTLLDEAIVHLQQPAVPGGVSGDDVVYGGDAASWIKVARGLKARYYLHLILRDSGAAQKALSALNAGTLESSSEDAMIPFDTTPTGANPYAQFGQQRPSTLVVDPQFMDMLSAKDDPRQAAYYTSGGDIYEAESSLFWSQNNSALPIISYTEVKFLEAEALVRTGNAPAAEAAFREAIAGSFAQLGLSGVEVEDYLNNYGAFTSGNANEQIKQIITEKYVALYAQGEGEVWTDYRRTGFPELTPKEGGSNGLNPSGDIPRRFIYPRDERIANADNVQAAIDRQGGALLSNDMWAFRP